MSYVKYNNLLQNRTSVPGKEIIKQFDYHVPTLVISPEYVYQIKTHNLFPTSNLTSSPYLRNQINST